MWAELRTEQKRGALLLAWWWWAQFLPRRCKVGDVIPPLALKKRERIGGSVWSLALDACLSARSEDAPPSSFLPFCPLPLFQGKSRWRVFFFLILHPGEGKVARAAPLQPPTEALINRAGSGRGRGRNTRPSCQSGGLLPIKWKREYRSSLCGCCCMALDEQRGPLGYYWCCLRSIVPLFAQLI